TGHPLYRAVSRLSRLTKEHPALRDGVQIQRHVADGTGVYAFSRIDPERRTEYLVAVNNAEEPRTATVPTGAARQELRPLYGTGRPVRSGRDGTVTLTVPALSAVVLQARTPLPRSAKAPVVSLTVPPAGAVGTVGIDATVSGDPLTRVVFAAQVGDGPWRTLGSADHAPYRVTQNVPAVPAGTSLRYKAVAVDGAGRTASARGATTAGDTPPPVRPRAERKHVVVHHQRPDGDYDGLLLRSGDTTAAFAGRDAYGAFAWIDPPEDGTALSFTVEKDGVPDGPARVLDVSAAGEVWTRQDSPLVDATRPAGAQAPRDPAKAVVHYHRPDGDYEGWGLHAWTGAAHPPEWNDPIAPVRQDPFGLVFEVDLTEGAGSLSYILHKKEQKDVPGDEALDFRLHGKEVWRLAGDPAYLSPSLSGAFPLDLGRQDAVWLDDTTVVWRGTGTGVASQQLVYAPEGGMAIEDGALTDEGRWLRLLPTTLTGEQRAAHPDYADLRAFALDPRDLDRAAEARTGQLIATQRAADGALLGATGVRLLPH
ncbi:pullulanase-associated domain-containing protein, partial [Streptomyces hydrogenans]|uniref:pullulanase-associated domain-containing protein n=1 Tax=Streptomyces hydrogenans TaxID=1873719 RepID=UPI0036547D34